MAILSDLPFRFCMRTEAGSKVTKDCYDNVTFYGNVDDLNLPDYQPEIYIEEGRDVVIEVGTDRPFRLEMDGFDASKNNVLQHADGTYLDTPNKEVVVFSYDDFPLPPGYYALVITCEEKNYYTGFKVDSIRFGDGTWQKMAEEVAEDIKNMAFQMVHQRMGIGKSGLYDVRMSSLIFRMAALDREFNKVIAALDDLRNNPHSKISKKYILKRDAGSYPADFKSNKLNSRNVKGELLFMPSKYTDYDLSDNRYVKKVVENIDKLVRDFTIEAQNRSLDLGQDMKILRRNQTRYNRLKADRTYLEEYLIKAKKIRYAISLLRACEWYRNIPKSNTDFLPAQSIMDPRYGILSKLNKDMQGDVLKFQADKHLSWIWKNSSILYEMWGFLKTIRAFQDLGFTLVEGPWITQVGTVTKIGGLASNDVVCLERGTTYIRVAYDKEMPRSSDQTDLVLDPVYSLDEKRMPDCKIDFYYKSNGLILYLGSLILDFKYRGLKALWNEKDENAANAQLISYSNWTRSKCLHNSSARQSNNTMLPVYEAWAIYPDKFDYEHEEEKFDYGVRLISLVPGHENVLVEHLERFMKEYL